jgi:ASC-1-like (ASCH) protein
MIDLLVDKKYFDAIMAGTKTAEGRINSPNFKALKPGMPIAFTCASNSNKKVICEIIAINSYPDFKTMLKKEGLSNMLPGIKDLEIGVSIYESFHGYKQAVKKDGAIAIRIKLNV